MTATRKNALTISDTVIFSTISAVSDMTDRELRCYRRQLRRQQKRRHKFMTVAMAVMTVCLVMVCAICYHSIRSSANSGGEDVAFKYYTSITVEAGETLWEIADEYIDYSQYKDKNAYIAEVVHINHLGDDAALCSGQRITVPYYSTVFVK